MSKFMRPSAPYTYPHRGSLEVTKFGVQELDAKEMVEVEGGIFLFILGAAATIAIGGFIYESINNYDDMVRASNEGYEAGKNAIKR